MNLDSTDVKLLCTPHITFRCDVCGEVAPLRKANDKKLIALDYDGTITVDIEFWVDFIKTTLKRGHDIVIATMRSQEERATMDPRILEICFWIVCTNRKAKLPFLNNVDIVPDIWIDDNPQWILADAV